MLKTKNKFARVLKLATIMSVALVIFVGCSKDEDNLNNPTTRELIGTVWIDDINVNTQFGFWTETTGNMILQASEGQWKKEGVFTYSYQHPNIRIDTDLDPFAKNNGTVYYKGVISENIMTLTIFSVVTDEVIGNFTLFKLYE